MMYFGLRPRYARVVASVSAVLFAVLASGLLAHRTLILRTRTIDELLGAGLAAGVILGWLGQYVTHHPVSRRVIIPWGFFGAATFVTVAIARTVPLSTQLDLVGALAFRAFCLAAAVRLLIDAARGPLSDVPSWGVTADQMPRWDDSARWTPASQLDLRPPSANPPSQPARIQSHEPDLHLIADKPPEEQPKKRRSSP